MVNKRGASYSPQRRRTALVTGQWWIAVERRRIYHTILYVCIFIYQRKRKKTQVFVLWFIGFRISPLKKNLFIIIIVFSSLATDFYTGDSHAVHARFLLQICRAWWSLCLAVSVRSALCYSSACRTGSVLRSQFIIWFFEKMKKIKRFFHIFKSKAFCGGREVSLVEQRIRHNC